MSITENLISSLDLSIKMKENGVKQESMLYWVYGWDGEKDKLGYFLWRSKKFGLQDWEEVYSAFTSDELMEMLPACINTGKNEPFNYFYLVLQKRTAPNIRYILNYNCDTHEGNEYFPRILIPHNIYDSNLANCLAKSLLWVKENGYLVE